MWQIFLIYSLTKANGMGQKLNLAEANLLQVGAGRIGKHLLNAYLLCRNNCLRMAALPHLKLMWKKGQKYMQYVIIILAT